MVVVEKLKSSKLFKLKKFLTLPEAAQRLSVSLGEEVKETDILKFALDGHLILSVNFVNVATAVQGHFGDDRDRIYGFLAREIQKLDMEICPLPDSSESEKSETLERIKDLLDESKNPPFRHDTLLTQNDTYYEFDDKVVMLPGIYDLPMIDGERVDIDRRYQKLENGIDVTLPPCDGVFVKDDEGFLFKLVDIVDKTSLTPYPDDYIINIQKSISESNRKVKENAEMLGDNPSRNDLMDIEKLFKDHVYVLGNAKHMIDGILKRNEISERLESMPILPVYKLASTLPKDSELLVRTQALLEFENILNEDITKNNNVISETERNNLLKQVAGIALVLAEKNSRYKKGDSVSANAVAESVIEIIDLLPNANKYGLGKTNIRESISKGIKLITESE